MLFFVSLAIDRSGLESLSSSSLFTVDLTPPTPGSFIIRYRGENAVKTSDDIIPVELENFEDPESGIDQFTIRINGPRENYVSTLMVENGQFYIRMKEDMTDGHEYKATVLVFEIRRYKSTQKIQTAKLHRYHSTTYIINELKHLKMRIMIYNSSLLVSFVGFQ